MLGAGDTPAWAEKGLAGAAEEAAASSSCCRVAARGEEPRLACGGGGTMWLRYIRGVTSCVYWVHLYVYRHVPYKSCSITTRSLWCAVYPVTMHHGTRLPYHKLPCTPPPSPRKKKTLDASTRFHCQQAHQRGAQRVRGAAARGRAGRRTAEHGRQRRRRGQNLQQRCGK